MFVRAEGGGTRFEIFDSEAWPTEGLVPLEVRKGALVVLNGLLPHMSRANRSRRSRHAYTLHVIEERSFYPSDNWLRRDSSLPLRGFD
jgi:phytanoyl-CoA hydroxylase